MVRIAVNNRIGAQRDRDSGRMAHADQKNDAAPRERTVTRSSAGQAGDGKYERGVQTRNSPQERLGHDGSLLSATDTRVTLGFVWQTYYEY